MESRWRKPLRLDLWDYSQPAIYHITVCIADRTDRLATIRDNSVEITPAGAMVQDHLLSLPDRFDEVDIDSFVIMPNHVHFIIEMNLESFDEPGLDLARPIQAFKSLTTRDYGVGVRNLGWRPYQGVLWQKRYFETIMRNENWLERHRNYIANNPSHWQQDPESIHRPRR